MVPSAVSVIESLLPGFVTLFVIVDPIGLVPLFLSLTAGSDDAHKRTMAIRATLTATGALLVFAVAGKPIMSVLGITLPAFRVAGGMLLFLIALEMLFDRRTPRKAKTAEEFHPDAQAPDDVSVFPLGIPLVCGPGAIASALLLMSDAGGDLARQAGVIVVILAVMALTLLTFLLAVRLGRYLGPTLNTVIVRLFGLLLAALAVQYVFDGLRAGLLTG